MGNERATPAVTVEPMSFQDLDAIYEIEEASYTLPWPRGAYNSEITENACARYLTLKEDGVPVAYAGMWLVMDEGHVTTIAVRPDKRRLGYGEKVTEALIRLAADSGVTSMSLECRRSNAAARSLYDKLGFIVVGVRKRYYPDNDEDALVMLLSPLPEGDPERDPHLIRE